MTDKRSSPVKAIIGPDKVVGLITEDGLDIPGFDGTGYVTDEELEERLNAVLQALSGIYATQADVGDVSNLATTARTVVGAINEIFGGLSTKFTSVSASSWVSSSTYADYAYQCSIDLTGVTSSDYCSVVFDVTEATSGNYAPVCTTYDGGVIIYSKVDTAITVPAIIKY